MVELAAMGALWGREARYIGHYSWDFSDNLFTCNRIYAGGAEYICGGGGLHYKWTYEYLGTWQRKYLELIVATK